MILYSLARAIVRNRMKENATLYLATPDQQHVLALNIPYHPLTVGGAIIRFADEHGIAAANVVWMVTERKPVLEVAA